MSQCQRYEGERRCVVKATHAIGDSWGYDIGVKLCLSCAERSLLALKRHRRKYGPFSIMLIGKTKPNINSLYMKPEKEVGQNKPGTDLKSLQTD